MPRERDAGQASTDGPSTSQNVNRKADQTADHGLGPSRRFGSVDAKAISAIAIAVDDLHQGENSDRSPSTGIDCDLENARLKRLLADAELDKAILREAASGNF